jgi:hypothetical protein
MRTNVDRSSGGPLQGEADTGAPGKGQFAATDDDVRSFGDGVRQLLLEIDIPFDPSKGLRERR